MTKERALTERPALDLLEDALALLRQGPASVLLLYYVGTAPCVLGFLYFWAEMSRGAFAREHLDESSLLVALGFVWCKWWQAIFSAHLLAAARRRPLPPWSWRRLARVAWPQLFLQPTGLFILPLAALITVPYGYATAFYQNLTVLALDEQGEPLPRAALRREAMEQARRWPRQNHAALGALGFFYLAVWLNLLIVILAFPWALKTFFGLETVFTHRLWSMFNTTLLTVSLGLAYLCVDPIAKAFYALRCFKGRAVATGEDLRVEARALPEPGRLRGLAAALALFCALLPGAARAAEPAPAPPPPAEVDRAIQRVLDRPEFAWRMPREAAPPEEKGWIGSFIEGASRLLVRAIKQVFRWIKAIYDWLAERFQGKEPASHEPASSGGSAGLYELLRRLSWVLLAGAAVALGALAWKRWRDRAIPAVLAAAPRPVPHDLTSEDVSADQLPEDEWLRLAREMAERGERRLALRALYLAALASLGAQQILSIARHKSNSDYQRELCRRRPGQAELQAVFAETVSAFERAWYGLHEVTREMLAVSQQNLLKLRPGPPPV